MSPKRAVGEIMAGTADYTPLGLYTSSFARRARGAARRPLRTRQPRRRSRSAAVLRQSRGCQLDYFVLNTHRTLFRDVRMRQAVNYAIDRRELARLGDVFQPLPAHQPTITCRRNARLPRHNRLSDDPERTPKPAQLARQAHAGGRTAVLYTCNAFPCPEQAQIVKNNLAAIGLRVEVEQFPRGELLAREAHSREPFDLAWSGWVPNYLDPGAMLTEILEDNTVGPTFDDPRLPAQARRRRATLRPRALPDLRQARPRSRPRSRTAGRVRQPIRTRPLLRPNRLPDLLDLRRGPRRALHQTRAGELERGGRLNLGPGGHRRVTIARTRITGQRRGKQLSRAGAAERNEHAKKQSARR